MLTLGHSDYVNIYPKGLRKNILEFKAGTMALRLIRFEVSLSLPGKQLRTSRSITYLLSRSVVLLPRERVESLAQTNPLLSSSRAGKPKVKSVNGTKCHPLV